MQLRSKLVAFALSGAMMTTFLAAPRMAQASEEGRRNTAILLGAASIYALSKKQTTLGIIGLGATAYAAQQLQNDINKRHERENRYQNRRRYDQNRYDNDRNRKRYQNDRRRYDNDRNRNDHDWDDRNRNDHDWDNRNRNQRRNNDWDRNDNRGNEHGKDRNKNRKWDRDHKDNGKHLGWDKGRGNKHGRGH